MIEPYAKIISLRDRIQTGFEEWLVAGAGAIHGQEVAQQCATILQRQEFAPLVAYAEVLQGRWVVRCPNAPCAGAQLALHGCERFWCFECLNAKAGNRWVTVAWPEVNDITRIERLLMERPERFTRNWLAQETVEDLAVQNRAHGLEGVIA